MRMLQLRISGLDDFKENANKKNLRVHFCELSDELLRILSVYRYCINIVYVLYKDFLKTVKRGDAQGSITNK